MKNKGDSKLITLRFLAVQLCATIAIALGRNFLPPVTSRANDMEATHSLV